MFGLSNLRTDFFSFGKMKKIKLFRLFHLEGSEGLKEPIQFEMKNTFSHWNKAFDIFPFSPPFFSFFFVRHTFSAPRKGCLGELAAFEWKEGRI